MMPSFNREEPYHRVLVIDFNYNDWWIVSQLAGLPKQLHIVKHQQLVPCRAKSLAQDLQHTYTHINSVYLPFLSLVVIQAHTRTIKYSLKPAVLRIYALSYGNQRTFTHCRISHSLQEASIKVTVDAFTLS